MMMMADDRPKKMTWSSSGGDSELLSGIIINNNNKNDTKTSEMEEVVEEEDLSIDLDLFWDILHEEDHHPPPLQNSMLGSAGKVRQGLLETEWPSSLGAELAEPSAISLLLTPDAMDSRASDCSVSFPGNPVIFDHQKQDLSAQAGSPVSCFGSLSEWTAPAPCLGCGPNPFIRNFSSNGREMYNETHLEIPIHGASVCFVHEGEYSARMSEIAEIGEKSMMDIELPTQWDLEGGYNSQFTSSKNDDCMTNVKNGWEGLATVPYDAVFETYADKMLAEDSNFSTFDDKREDHCEDNIFTASIRGSCKLDCGPKAASNFLPLTFADSYSSKHVVSVKNALIDDFLSKRMTDSSHEGNPEKSSVDGFSGSIFTRLMPPVPPSSGKKFVVHAKDEKEDSSLQSKNAHLEINGSANTMSQSVVHNHFVDPKVTSVNKLFCKNDEIVGELARTQNMDADFSKVNGPAIHTTAIVNSFHVDDNSDACIVEVPGEVLRSNNCPMKRKFIDSSQCYTVSDPLHYMGMGGLKLKANDEHLVLRGVLQDLSQPKTEAIPPDGVLAVPLLRHQRIALSWMVQKETTSLHCSGGILADDQGLGKTISTIALILKERPLSSSASSENDKEKERETFNLDEDDECASGLGGVEQDADACDNLSNGSLISSCGFNVRAKGRPRAGTLVVCPTSVLRQWADELHNKVTRKGNLSVLVYHGSNRTKDPCELAKYDVVLTTYSIVSMEVPKQPLVDKDVETGRDESLVVPSMGLSSSKKRKYPPTLNKGSTKVKKEIDSSFLEPAARPLARVGWFRVVLDEAQSIKNHRTQVARACCGLRAKRRWCLSGTPIQNAVDDLYSYFRFLRYDPYATYRNFCSSIKVPINRNPTTGYKKLQAVLKTVMLRRTKGTLLDGEPIINLPPKSVELKKVDFTHEERDFYCHLEANSRAQFAKYAAAGTVKQNYVNILLMLLRLRQACDHPLLVRGCESSSTWMSGIEIAKNLPRQKQVDLLNCLEASLAICGVCNDPPEDAVVTSCGHVYCKQCICEQLIGDDHQCPARNCKYRLSASSVFSKATLKCCLSQDPGQDDTPDCSVSEVSDKLECSPWGPTFDSSKIKAALKVLESLSKPKHFTDNIATFPKKSADPFAMEEESGMDVDDDEDADLVEGSKELVKTTKEKAIVFSQWTRMLDLLETGLKSSSIQYRRLDGTMSVVARDKALKEFKTLPEVTVMIMSLKAASLGLNMVAACHVILLDLWWNPTTEDQAVDRAHRIGQTRPVSVLRLTVKDTVEDRILALQQKKREMVASAFGEDETGSNQTRLTVEDLKYLFMA